jgi:hypothetical protein
LEKQNEVGKEWKRHDGKVDFFNLSPLESLKAEL